MARPEGTGETVALRSPVRESAREQDWYTKSIIYRVLGTLLSTFCVLI